MAPCTPGSQQLQSSAAPVVNNKWALSARSTGPCTPMLLPAPPLLPPSPRAAQAPLQHPPSLPTWDGHPEVRDTPGHCSMRSDAPDRSRGGGRAGTVWRREESRAVLELPETSTRNLQSFVKRRKVGWVSLQNLPSFKNLSASSGGALAEFPANIS